MSSTYSARPPDPSTIESTQPLLEQLLIQKVLWKNQINIGTQRRVHTCKKQSHGSAPKLPKRNQSSILQDSERGHDMTTRNRTIKSFAFHEECSQQSTLWPANPFLSLDTSMVFKLRPQLRHFHKPAVPWSIRGHAYCYSYQFLQYHHHSYCQCSSTLTVNIKVTFALANTLAITILPCSHDSLLLCCCHNFHTFY